MTTPAIPSPSTVAQPAPTKRRPAHAAGWIRSAVFGAVLTLAAMPGHAQKWVKLDEGLQYDTQSLRVNGSLRQIWVQMDLAPDRKGDEAPVMRMLLEFDCKEPRFRTLAIDHYTRKGVLRAKGGNETKTDWSPVTGKHEGEKVMRERICALRG